MCRDKKKITLHIKRTNLSEKSLHVQRYIICWISDADSKIRAHLLTKQLGQSFSQLETGQFPW